MIARFIKTTCFAALAATVSIGAAIPAAAQGNPFAKGWTLQNEQSALDFQSVKNQTKVESSSFATFSGGIDENGAAHVTVMLESVDTKIDLRNVRMRFLFFESFQFPEATITAQLDPALLADLPTVRRKTIEMPYAMNLHGVLKTAKADVVVTLLSDDLVSVATKTPISVAAADFNLMGGIEKLEDAAKVDIIPSASVTFDFMFARNADPVAEPEAAPATDTEEEKPAQVALEPTGNFSTEACEGRFEILSRSNNTYFTSGNSILDGKSEPFLISIADIVKRCPDMTIEVGGHTDNIGSDAANMRLSERRAASVVQNLVAKGVPAANLTSAGYGETQPKADNATKKGRWDNRRIEFRVIKGASE
ncbi:OmpA family protein [Roseobacter sp. N2S]|uniref:OmpA family protein n=1 Tax=Roseobacter sp. N2S TaxID=2663844 RepID=UPI002864ECC7|nr:OmpA family protein [Roseobacter sp. N2S]MDR6263770.1 outer membrane protein OmpA-like peptidoglycan-associated protein [Roseobacter sp. N2S]